MFIYYWWTVKEIEMTQASEILKLIEEVDPEDVEDMFTIDCYVWWFLNPDEHVYFDGVNDYIYGAWMTFNGSSLYNTPPKYTLSRDALKRIRPEGWWFQLTFHGAVDIDNIKLPNRYDGTLWHKEYPWKSSKNLPTEELAELHAIIQAIEYERETKSK